MKLVSRPIWRRAAAAQASGLGASRRARLQAEGPEPGACSDAGRKGGLRGRLLVEGGRLSQAACTFGVRRLERLKRRQRRPFLSLPPHLPATHPQTNHAHQSRTPPQQPTVTLAGTHTTPYRACPPDLAHLDGHKHWRLVLHPHSTLTELITLTQHHPHPPPDLAHLGCHKHGRLVLHPHTGTGVLGIKRARQAVNERLAASIHCRQAGQAGRQAGRAGMQAGGQEV